MNPEINLEDIQTEIQTIKKSADALKQLGDDFPAAHRNAKRILASVKMLEINVSGESSKYGLSPEEAPDVLELSKTLANTEIAGLMTIPPFAPDPERARPFFRRLRELRDRWRLQSGIPLEELSMGMSGDFEVAVEEGATWVRIGSALFGTRTGGAWRLSAEDNGGEMP